MPASIFKAGAWHPLNKLSTFKSAAWREILAGWVFKSSAWHKFYDGLSATLAFAQGIRTTAGVSATASIQVNTDGFVYGTNVGGTLISKYQWKTGGGAVGDYSVGYTAITVGTAPSSGPAINVFSPLSSSVQWNNTQAVVGTKNTEITVQIRMTASPFTVLATATFSIVATRGS